MSAAVTTPVDVRALNALAGGLVALAVLAFAAAAVAWLMRSTLFAVRAIELEGDLQRNSVSTIRANAMPVLAGNVLRADLSHTRTAFESVPWVRRAVVRRVWPDRLAVRLEEHRAVALWVREDGNDRLVNSFGEVFEANVGDVEDDALPMLSGPEDSAMRMLSVLHRLQPLFALHGRRIERLELSARQSWRATLDGDVVIEIGRGTDDEVVARTGRFSRTLTQLNARLRAPLLRADLRHADGYAVRLQGVTPLSVPGAQATRTP